MRGAIVRDGVVAGVLGATSVAAWFLLIDLAFKHPFHTPVTLGRAFFGLLGRLTPTDPDLYFLVGYTVFHYLAFILAGLLVAVIVDLAEREPTVLAGALVLFVVFEVGFHALLSIFRAFPVLGVLAWHNVAVGNLIAAFTMGAYMWWTHPALKEELRFALESRE